MRRVVPIGVLAMALLVMGATPSDAWRGSGGGGRVHSSGGRVHSSGGHFHGGSGHFHGHGGHFHGRFFVGSALWWGAAYPYWWYYGPPYYAYAPPPVVVQESQTYAQAAPAQAQEPQAYWYYCASAGAYYPTAPTCPEVWIKVPPRSE